MTSTRTITGTSGAFVEVGPDVAFKYSDPATPVGDRLLAQAEYIRQLDVPILPKIIAVSQVEKSYSMERLLTPPWDIVDYNLLFMHLVERLNHWLWTYDFPGYTPPSTDGWPERHISYIEARAREFCPELWPRLRRKFEEVPHAELREAVIHGDPTFDNVMLRDSGQLVIIDPLPPSLFIPSLVAVDIGKLLQSAAGYERLKYGRQTINFDVHRALNILNLDYVERKGALWFCYAHYVRLLPYQPLSLRLEFVELLNQLLSTT